MLGYFVKVTDDKFLWLLYADKSSWLLLLRFSFWTATSKQESIAAATDGLLGAVL